MQVRVFETKQEMGGEAAAAGAEVIHRAIDERSSANVVLATGASQFEILAALATTEDIDWSQVTFSHLDEYIDMPITHPASFRKYLKERFVDQLPIPPAAFHYIDAEGDGVAECERLSALVSAQPVDVAFVGIGENGHLAFNDPPADFETEQPYLVVELDEACRRQQLGEGWFPTLDDVPRQAISMSIRQILKSRRIICTAPDQRKAQAVRGTVDGPLTADVPASILQTHDAATLYLDRPAASLLSSTN